MENIEELKRELEETKKSLTDQQIIASQLSNYLSVNDLKLNAMQTIITITTSSMDFHKVLSSLMDVIIDTMKVEAGSLLLINDDNELEFKVAKGEKSKEIMGFKVKLGEGVAGWVAETGQSKILPEADSKVEVHEDIEEAVDYKVDNIVCVPMKVKDKTIGVIELMNKIGKRRFIKDDLDLLMSLASEVALVIENAKLLEEYQVKIKELSNLINISSLINSTLNLDKILTEVMEAASVMLEASASSIFLIDEEKQELYFKIATGEFAEKVKEIRIPINEGVAGWVATEKKALLVPDVGKDPRFNKKVDEKSKFITKSILAVPLEVKNKIIGVVEVLNKINGDTFSKTDISLLEALADQAAIAIDNAMTHEQLRELFKDTLRSLAATVEAKDTCTGGHIERLSQFSLAIAYEYGLPYEDKERIHYGALLHDIGKISVPEAILMKPGPLTPEEYSVMKKHPEIGANIIKQVKQFQYVIPGILHHHERFDGRGYPRGLKEGEISIDGRIIAVADTFDAMTADRPYRKGLPYEVAIGEIKKSSGSQFDPKVVDAFLTAYYKGDIVPNIPKEEHPDGVVQENKT
jgi:putative nucleotidyltransferase with HDIG domain